MVQRGDTCCFTTLPYVAPNGPDELAIRNLEPSDLDSLIECVRRCYGDSYPEADFYDRDALNEQLITGRLISNIAVTPEGGVAGHIGARTPFPGDLVADSIAGFVDPAYRGHRVIYRAGAAMARRFLDRGVRGLRHCTTGAHDRTQRPIVAAGGVATGVLLGHAPAGTDFREIGHDFGNARIGVVVYYQGFEALPPLSIHPPTRYADRIEAFAREIGIERTIVSEHTASSETFAAEVHHDRHSGISHFRLTAERAQEDRALAGLLEAEASRCGPVGYVDVPLCDPRAARQIDWLAEHGFFFGAWLPGTAKSEMLRMQRIVDAEVAPEKIRINARGGNELLHWIAEVERAQH